MFRHKALGWAVVELRARMQWGQEDLAHEINRLTYHPEEGRVPRPNQQQISDWENGKHAPGRLHRWALGKIARSHNHDDLADVFCANDASLRVAELLHSALPDEES